MTETQTPTRYEKQDFTFGKVAVAFFEDRGVIRVTYWGNDGVFESASYVKDGNNNFCMVCASAGKYDVGKVRTREFQDGVPPKISENLKAINGLVGKVLTE